MSSLNLFATLALMVGLSFGFCVHADTYLNAPDGAYVEVTGDGLEEGFRFNFEIKTPEPAPTLEIPDELNSASCEGGIVEARAVSGPDGELLSTLFSVEVVTSVGGDTGGCEVIVKQAGEVIKVVNYRYITDY